MFSDLDIAAFVPGSPGKALTWVIDGQCLYDIPVEEKYLKYFESHDRIDDVSSQYPNHDGIVVRFYKDNEFEDFATSEYFGSILLSEPQVVNLEAYPYGRYVRSPYATFDGERFHITNRDVSLLMPWYSET